MPCLHPGKARRRREPGQAGGHGTHLTIMCLWLVLMPGAAQLPKSHSRLHEKADPAVVPTDRFRSFPRGVGNPSPWHRAPHSSGTDESGSAGRAGNGVPVCHGALLSASTAGSYSQRVPHI